MKWFANFLIRRLEEKRPTGQVTAPGGTLFIRETDDNGATLIIVSHGDSFDVYQGQRYIYNFALSPRVMLKLARWVLWTYFIRGTWCGLKTRLWLYAVRVRNRPDPPKKVKLDAPRQPAPSLPRNLDRSKNGAAGRSSDSP